MNNSLNEEIKKFQNEKKKYFIILMILGFVGLIVPVIPGLLLISMGFALLKPNYGDELIVKLKAKLKSLFH